MPNNNEDPKPIRKTWTMIKVAPPAIDYTKGAAAIWTGENGLNENNEWIDKTGTYKFTPIRASVVPAYDKERKLLDFNAYGGMKSNLTLPATSDTPYTLELVMRDMNESSSAGGNWGKILGPEMSGWYNKSNTYAINGTWNHTGLPAGQQNTYCIDYYVGSKQTTYRSTTERQAGLTTITVIPTQGLWVNGIKENEFNLSCTATLIALASGIGSNASYSATQFKVHAVRYYPTVLTDEEIMKNYKADIKTYGE